MTKKITIKQRQEIYERLLTLDCPDLLAALIAERSEVYALEILDYVFLNVFIKEAFIWRDTPEGFEFWQMIHESALEIEVKGKHLEEHPLDYDLPVDLEHKLAQTIKVKIENPRDEPSEMPWWNKVKLFLGKWVYKV